MQISLWRPPRNRPIPLTCSWPDFVTFTACKKSRFGLKRAKRRNAFQTGAKIYLSEKKYFGVRCTLKTSLLCFQRLHALANTVFIHEAHVYVWQMKFQAINWNWKYSSLQVIYHSVIINSRLVSQNCLILVITISIGVLKSLKRMY